MEGLSKNRSLSMPVLNSEEAVIKKVQEQDGIIALMQTQIEFQSEVISKHDKMFQEVLSKMDDLTSKVKLLEDLFTKEKESADRDAKKSALWASTGGSESVSIADMVKETAEQTLGAESGYVYDEKLGLYFDQNSGYYYDPVKQLFYNGHTKTYYSYDAATSTYHIQPSDSVKRKKIGKMKPKKATKQQRISTSESTNVSSDCSQKNSKPKQTDVSEEPGDDTVVSIADVDSNSNSPAFPEKPSSDMEEGELNSSAPNSPEADASVSYESESSDEVNGDDRNRQVTYPPCIRAVVQSDSSAGLKTGTLFVIPCTGGTIGSKGKDHTVLLPTPSVEKKHAKIYFQNDPSEDDDEPSNETGSGKYFIVDLGSTEGTYLNRNRISEAGVQSEPFEVVHGSTLQIGDITLLIHIHPGDFTCGHCEPGLLLQKDPMYEYTGANAETVRRSEMKKMKQKYGLDRRNENVKAASPEAQPVYTDRAKTRRKKVGSDNPFAKTEVASAASPIRESNVGFKMLKKMGWKGEGLGTPQNSGITEPINCEVKNDRGGLGLQGAALLAAPSTAKAKGSIQKKSENLSKTIERFQKNSPAEDLSKVTEDFDY